jgi:hypothetical protein
MSRRSSDISYFGSFVIFLTLVALGCVVSTMDFEDEQIQQDHYAEMVCEGSWPDYKQINPECPKKQKQQQVLDSVILGTK